MKPFPKLAVGAFLVSAASLSLAVENGFDLLTLFGKLQTALFTGFLTLGGFLLSLKTFILVQLKKELYDSARYKQHFQEVQETQRTASLYAPLKNLGDYLLQSVLLSICTSGAQLTIGLWQNRWAALFCVAMALTTLIVVLRAWFSIRKTLHEWFSQLE